MRGVRVVELDSTVASGYCTRLFAATGADVVCVEGASGARLRHTPPFVDAPTGRRSATWEYLAAGKRSVVADPSTADFERLLAWADVVVAEHDGAPDAAHQLYDRLQRCNPAAVHVAISGFGLTGPYRTWRRSSLTDWAAGGQMFITGEPDREPLQGGGPWASYLTGATAAIGAQVAVLHAARTGRGQLVDVAALEAMANLHQWTLTMYTHTGVVKQRWGNRFGESVHPIALYPCTDGWISIVAPVNHQWEALCIVADMVELLADERLVAPAERFDRADEIDARIDAWLAGRSCAEAVDALQAAGVPASRLLTMSEVMQEPHLDERGFWTDLPHVGPMAKMPTRPFRLGGVAAAPAVAPALGEHTDQVSAEVATGAGPRALPDIDLGSTRVVEFGVAWAGPLAGRFLADLGAEVIMVEHPTSRGIHKPQKVHGWTWGQLPDPQVRFPVFPDADPGERWWNRMGIFNKMNRSKRSVCLDAKEGDGPDVLRDLLAAADVVLHNFSPRGARSLGIDAASVRACNQQAVTVSMTGYGEAGPLSGNLSYGPVLQAHAGFDAATGYADSGPVRLGLAFPDAVGGVHGAFAIIAALWERELGGGPVHVDLSQLETLLSIAGEMLLATSWSGRDPVRHGNGAEGVAPQGAFRAAGADAWVAVTVQDDPAWRRLVELVAPGDGRHLADLDLAARQARSAELGELIEGWTSQRPAVQAAEALQGAGVVAFPVMTNRDLVESPHVAERGFIVEWDQPDVGRIAFPGFPIHFSGRAVTVRPCPPLGGDNDQVLRGVLGYDEDRLEKLVEQGVLASRPPE